MPNIVVQVVNGLSDARKVELGRAIAAGVERSIGLPPSRVNVYFDESSHYKDGQLTVTVPKS